MLRIGKAVRSFVANEEGAAMVEYAILVAFIAVVSIVIITTLGSKISLKFSEIATKF